VQEVAGNYHALDFARAFANGHQAGIAIDPFNGEFPAVAITTMHLDGIPANTLRHFGGEEFRHRCLLSIRSPFAF
jgi:hypothetical protein